MQKWLFWVVMEKWHMQNNKKKDLNVCKLPILDIIIKKGGYYSLLFVFILTFFINIVILIKKYGKK